MNLRDLDSVRQRTFSEQLDIFTADAEKEATTVASFSASYYLKSSMTFCVGHSKGTGSTG